MKFGYTIIYVDAVENTLDFYKKAFGFETRFLHPSKTYGELDTGETAIAFAANTLGDLNFKGGYQKIDPQDLPVGVELAFVTEDVSAAYAHALLAGAVSVAEPMQKPWGQSVAYVRDLNGVLVELCSPMGEG